jgi:hypothetical protein
LFLLFFIVLLFYCLILEGPSQASFILDSTYT